LDLLQKKVEQSLKKWQALEGFQTLLQIYLKMTDEKSNRVKGRLQLSKAKLNTILEITKAINKNSSRENLFEILNTILVDEIGIDRFVFFTFENNWKVSLKQGITPKEVAEINIYSIVNDYDSIDVVHSSTEVGTNQFDIVIPVFHNGQAFAYLLLADLNGEKLEISPIIRNLRFIQTLANIIVVALENKRLHKEELKQLAIKKELEMAQSMQSLLFPKNLPKEKSIEVEAFYLPHSEVGGDYYDVIKLSEHKTVLCIADVSGKGMPAALLMANFQANLRAQLEYAYDLEELIRKINKKVIESVHYEKFITLFIAIFDSKLKTLTYLNAGHQPALIIKENRTLELKKGCTILGMFDDLPIIESGILKIEKGDKFICYTDGLTELESEDGVQLEVDGIKKLIKRENSIQEIKSNIVDKIYEMEVVSGLEDDVTLLAAQFLQ
jgi:sigma-B regulation protein RsbU (phosphoserine phosphatase)